MAGQKMRRVVIHDNSAGKSAVLVDEMLSQKELGGGTTAVPLWRTDSVPTLPNDGTVSDVFGVPVAGGSWAFIWTLAPGSAPESGGDLIDMKGQRPGFHATDTVDIDYIISGNPTLSIDEGDVELNPGDSIILNGNAHAWRNLKPTPAVILTVMNGAKRSK